MTQSKTRSYLKCGKYYIDWQKKWKKSIVFQYLVTCGLDTQDTATVEIEHEKRRQLISKYRVYLKWTLIQDQAYSALGTVVQ